MAERFFNIELRVNGEQVAERVEARKTLVDFLRDDLGLTGTHIGCEQGVCGNCTVLVNGQAVKSCLMFAPQADGQRVTTVESLGEEEELHPLQQAFKDAHALQCGYCTPGFLMAAVAIAAEGRSPSRDELREELSGVICRCTGYENILTAVGRYLDERAEIEALRG